MNYADFATKHLDVRTRAGDEWQALCPYHNDSSPSFSINIKRGLFVCYACGAKGTAKSLAKYLNTGERFDQVSSVDDVKAKIAEMTKPPVKQRVVAPEWLDYWRSGDIYRGMWAQRSITDDQVLDYFCLGYDPMEHALVIPVHDYDGKVVSEFRRMLDPEPGVPKYKYERGFKISECLYGAWQVRTYSPVSRPRIMAITEGSIDTLTLWQAGIPSVALLGARFSKRQQALVKALDPMQVLICTDRDQAGRQAAFEITQALRQSGIIITEPSYWPKGAKDIGEMERDDVLKVVGSSTRC